MPALQGPEVEMVVLVLLLLADAEVTLKAQESESKVAVEVFIVERCWDRLFDEQCRLLEDTIKQDQFLQDAHRGAAVFVFEYSRDCRAAGFEGFSAHGASRNARSCWLRI